MSATPSLLHDRPTLDDVIAEVEEECASALTRFPAFNSPHEGWAVIHEELDELWSHVRENTGNGEAARREAIQIAAMALRYVIDLSDYEEVA